MSAVTDEVRKAATDAMVQALVKGGMAPKLAQEFTDEVMAATIAASEASGRPPGVDTLSPETVQGILERLIAKPTKKGKKAKRDKYSPDEPRDDHGRFGSGDGGASGTSDPVRVSGSGTADDPLKTNDVETAAKALGEGKHVELDQPRTVGTLLNRLAEIGRQAKEQGVQAPTYDLCNVSVPGTNLFCTGNKGIDRINMPQLKGTPLPGSPASKMPADVRGEVDVTAGFLQSLRDQGLSFTNENEDVKYLHASQDQLDGVKVGQIMQAAEAGRLDTSNPIVVSEGNYIVDGHHRWAAQVGEEYDPNTPDKVITTPIVRINTDIGTLLDAAKQYAAEQGIPQKGVNAPMSTAT